MAATLQECINDIARDLAAIGNTVPTVATRMTTRWIPQMFTDPAQFPLPGVPWNRDSALQRTVYDWSVETIRANAAIAELPVGQEVQAANIAINVVYRTLLAVQAAAADNRITANQVTSVVTVYTSSWE